MAVDCCEQVVLGLRRPNRRPENKEAGSRHDDEPSHQTPSSSEPPCRVKWGERTNAVGRTRVAKRSSCPGRGLFVVGGIFQYYVLAVLDTRSQVVTLEVPIANSDAIARYLPFLLICRENAPWKDV